MTRELEKKLNGFDHKKSGAYHLLKMRQKERELDEYRFLYQVRGHHLIPYARAEVIRYQEERNEN